jgi:hypothetical protein
VTLLVREVARFLLESAIWLGAAIAIAAVVGCLASRFSRADARYTIGWCVVGAIVAAAVADRLGLPATSTPSVGTRPVPVLWLILGSVGTAIVVVWRSRQESPAV